MGFLMQWHILFVFMLESPLLPPQMAGNSPFLMMFLFIYLPLDFSFNFLSIGFGYFCDDHVHAKLHN